jgi:hypothetical protein
MSRSIVTFIWVCNSDRVEKKWINNVGEENEQLKDRERDGKISWG